MSGRVVPLQAPGGTTIDGVKDFKRKKDKRKKEIEQTVRTLDKDSKEALRNVDLLIAAGKSKDAKIQFKKHQTCTRMMDKLNNIIAMNDQLYLDMLAAEQQMKNAALQKDATQAYRNINNGMPESMVIGATQKLQMERDRTTMRISIVDDAGNDLMESMLEDPYEEEDGAEDGGLGSAFETYLNLKEDQKAQTMMMPQAPTAAARPLTNTEKAELEWEQLLSNE